MALLLFDGDHYLLRTLEIKSLALDHSGTQASHIVKVWGKTQSHVPLVLEELRLSDPQNSPMGPRTLRLPGLCSPLDPGITACGFSAAFDAWLHGSALLAGLG